MEKLPDHPILFLEILTKKYVKLLYLLRGYRSQSIYEIQTNYIKSSNKQQICCIIKVLKTTKPKKTSGSIRILKI